MAGDHSNDDVNNMGNTENHSQQKEYNTIESVSMEHTEPIVTLSQPTSNPGNYDGLNGNKNMEDMIRMVHEINSDGVETNGSCQGMFNVPSDLNKFDMRTHVDVVAELFGVSLKTPKDIDDFTKGIELGKYKVWSELTSDKRKEVMDTICAMWDDFVAENPNVTSAHSSDSVKTGSLKSMDNGNKNLDDIVHVDDPIAQSVSIQDKPSSYVATAGGSLPEPSVDFSIPSKVFETVSTRFANTLYGYFIGLEDVLENGPWMICNIPIILKKWSMNTRLCKEELTRILVWVIIHDVLIQVFSEDGLSIIASQIESLTMGVPLIEDMGFTIETVTIEYEWKPPRCDLCKIFGHVPDHCPKKVSITPIVDTPIVEKTNDGFQTVRKKKKNGKSKSNNGVQFGGQSVKQCA
ncbi:zinc knuckle CX2CX4HX4C containing protein [Tanacetum coccineum]